jgi:hypothetical protein
MTTATGNQQNGSAHATSATRAGPTSMTVQLIDLRTGLLYLEEVVPQILAPAAA